MLMCQLMGASFSQEVHRKSTDKGCCLNYKSECPNRYKVSEIKTYFRRVFKICFFESLFHQELDKIKKLLVNNRYSNLAVDEELIKFKRHMYRQTDERLHLFEQEINYAFREWSYQRPLPTDS